MIQINIIRLFQIYFRPLFPSLFHLLFSNFKIYLAYLWNTLLTCEVAFGKNIICMCTTHIFYMTWFFFYKTIRFLNFLRKELSVEGKWRRCLICLILLLLFSVKCTSSFLQRHSSQLQKKGNKKQAGNKQPYSSFALVVRSSEQKNYPATVVNGLRFFVIIVLYCNTLLK